MFGPKHRVIMEEIEAKVYKATSGRLAINLDMCFREVPSPGSHKQDGCARVELIHLVPCSVFVSDGTIHGIPKIDMSPNRVPPRRGQRVFEICLREDVKPNSHIIRIINPLIITHIHANLGFSMSFPLIITHIHANLHFLASLSH